MSRIPKTETGCRPDSLFGVWLAIEAEFDQLSEVVLAVLNGPNFEIVCKDSADHNSKELERIMHVEGPVGHVNVSGMMTRYPTSFSSLTGGTSLVRLSQALHKLDRDKDVHEIAMHFNTPGGTSDGMAEFANLIRTIGSRKHMTAIVESKCGSAGYWAASQCHEIISEPGAEVGSVGGFTVLQDTSEVAKQQGRRFIKVTNAGAEFKGIGAPGDPITPAQVQDVQRRVESQVNLFKADIQRNRKFTPEQLSTIFKASAYESTEAKALGLVDDVRYIDEATTKVNQQAVARRDNKPADQPQRIAAQGDSMLTEAELKLVQAFPGCDKATAENGIATMLSVAEHYRTDASTAATANTNLTAANTQLTTEVANLKLQLPKKLDEVTVESRATAYTDRISGLKAAGKISPGGAEPLLKMMGEKGKRPDFLFADIGDGKTHMDSILASVQESVPVPPPKGTVVEDPNKSKKSSTELAADSASKTLLDSYAKNSPVLAAAK